MDLDALLDCVTTSSCVVTQSVSGLIVGMLLFLVAAGLTLIFGVLKIVNFAHGTFYMLGAYLEIQSFVGTGSYVLGVLAGGAGMAVFGVVFERFLIRRVYGANVLMQLLIRYAVVLICDDLVKIVWGPDFHAMGMPPEFQVPPFFVAGGVVPPFYIVLIVVDAADWRRAGAGPRVDAAGQDDPRGGGQSRHGRHWGSIRRCCIRWFSPLAACWRDWPAAWPRRCGR